MKNIQMIIAYKGTRYAGWQRQPNAPTVEEALTGAIKAVTGETVTLYGAGRTDAGVHALGQSAHFHTESRVPPERFAAALNTRLPGDIRVLSSCEAPKGFHSRYSAKGKVYTYQLYLNPVLSPFYAEYSWHVNYPVDVSRMKAASAAFLGEHDFCGFMAAGSSVRGTVRTIRAITFEQEGALLRITYTGNGFLYNMVRIMTGTLAEIGMGRIKAEALPGIIASCDRKQAGMTAPPQGLFLREVLY